MNNLLKMVLMQDDSAANYQDNLKQKLKNNSLCLSSHHFRGIVDVFH